MSARTLVVNADDLALHPAVNEGIFEAHECGILRSASIIATGAAVDEVCRYARAHPALDLGVHLTLMDVSPAGDPAPWRDLLDDDGRLPPSVAPRSLARLLPRLTRRPDDATAEFAAQIQRVRELGLRPTHLDSHNHLHLWPGLFARVARLCRDEGIPFLRVPRGAVRRLPRRPWQVDRATVKGAAIRLLGRAVSWRLPPQVRTPDHLVGLGRFGPGAGPEQAVRLVAQLGPGITEWLVHPVCDSAAFQAAFPWGEGWGRELRTLCDPAVATALRRGGVRVAGFGELS